MAEIANKLRKVKYMTLNIYNALYKNRESDYPFGFLSQKE